MILLSHNKLPRSHLEICKQGKLSFLTSFTIVLSLVFLRTIVRLFLKISNQCPGNLPCAITLFRGLRAAHFLMTLVRFHRSSGSVSLFIFVTIGWCSSSLHRRHREEQGLTLVLFTCIFSTSKHSVGPATIAY